MALLHDLKSSFSVSFYFYLCIHVKKANKRIKDFLDIKQLLQNNISQDFKVKGTMAYGLHFA